MEQIIDINGYTIEKTKIDKITQEIINTLSQKKYHTCYGIYDIRKCKARIRKYYC